MRTTNWMNHAACRGMYGLHFVEEKGKNAERQRTLALSVCARCPVHSQCRDYVLSSPHIELGIWGGLTERARTRMRVRRSLRCEWCNTPFELANGNERMCSDECRRAAKDARDREYKRRRVS